MGNSSAEITLKNQTLSDMKRCSDSKIRHSEEGGGMENLFENRHLKAAQDQNRLGIIQEI